MARDTSVDPLIGRYIQYVSFATSFGVSDWEGLARASVCVEGGEGRGDLPLWDPSFADTFSMPPLPLSLELQEGKGGGGWLSLCTSSLADTSSMPPLPLPLGFIEGGV